MADVWQGGAGGGGVTGVAGEGGGYLADQCLPGQIVMYDDPS